MLEPTVFLFSAKDSEYTLYLGEYSTIQGLRLFDNHQKIIVTKAGGKDLSNEKWITEKDLVNFINVQHLIDFLNSNQQIDWTNIEIEIEGFGSFSAHDDGECHFLSKHKKQLMSLVDKTITSRDALPLKISLIDNPNSYLEYHVSGNINVYPTFEKYLESRE